MKKRNKLVRFIILSLISSIVVGILLQGNDGILALFSPLGTLYVNLIKMVMVPLVFTSLVLGVSSIGDWNKLEKIGLLTVVIFICTTAGAVILGIILSNIFKPGIGMVLVNETYKINDFPNIIDTFVGIVPSNPFTALIDGNMLQVIFISIVLGVGIAKSGEKGVDFNNALQSLYEVISIITEGVMYMTPIGIFGLMTPVIANNGLSVLLPLIKVILVFFLGVVIQVGMYCLLISKYTELSVKEFFKGMWPAMIVAFTTCSSAAALPVSLKQIKSELKVSREVSSFVLSLGATINMDGNALYQGIVALFVAQAYGLELSISNMMMVVLTGTVASIGAAGVPGAGMIVLSTVLTSVGLPVDGIILVAGIDRILDMGRTFVNITGDTVTACSVDKHMKKFKA